jgi:PKD repeat protein
VSATHTYAAAGVYTLTLTVTDKDGASGQCTFQFVVVFNPNDGFVTGGGWINSPPGAYTADPTLTGKATFGFVAKYIQGSNTPSGNTEFQFKAGDLNFKSSSYDVGSLVIAAKKAMYKGSGTINGSGDYAFRLTAIDGDLQGGDGIDKFRIKIWNKTTNAVIYDNQLGGGDYDDPTTALGGGSITIHKA